MDDDEEDEEVRGEAILMVSPPFSESLAVEWWRRHEDQELVERALTSRGIPQSALH